MARLTLRLRATTTLIAACLLSAWCAAAEPVEKITWREGAEFRTAVSLPGGASWNGSPLGPALDELGKMHRVRIIRDRRIDPETPLVYELRNVSFETMLQGLAKHFKLGVAIGDSWVYIGPPETARKLNTLIELRKDELTKLPVAARSGWSVKHAVKFPEATQPRTLLESIATTNKLMWNGLDTIPHDLWSATDWPRVTRFEELSLILAQFDATWEFSADGKTLTIVPIPKDVVMRRDYTVGNVDPTSQLKKLGVQAVVERNGKTLRLTGSAEEHRILGDLLAGKQVKTTAIGPGEQRFTLNVKTEDGAGVPVGKAIEHFAPKMGLTPRFEKDAITAAGLTLDKPVKVAVQNATREELFRAVLEPAGLRGRIEGETLIIEPAPR